jgi:hypothetical protein
MIKEHKNSGPGLVIGLPTLGRPVPLDWAMAFKSMNPPINYNSTIHLVKGKPVADAREEIAENAVKIGAKYLFFVGDDVVCPGHTLRQLIYRMENNDSIGCVGGVYCAKCDPCFPLVFRGNGRGAYWDWKIGEFFEVTGLGMDCTLIRVEILSKMSRPWFKTVDEEGFLDGVNKCESWTEDLYFYKKMKDETQFSIYCDASVICEHWDIYNEKSYSLPLDSLPRRQLVVDAQKKKCLLVGYESLPENTSDEEFTFVAVSDSDRKCDYRVDYSALPFDHKTFHKVIVGPTVNLRSIDVAELQRVQI